MEINEIRESIRERASKNPALGSTVKFMIGEHAIFIDGSGDENIVTDENREAACTIEISESDFSLIMTGELNPMMATMMGKMKISGDMGLAMKLQSLI